MISAQRLIIVLFAAVSVVASLVQSRPARNIPDRAAFHVLTSSMGYLKLQGDVKHPGVYPAVNNVASIVNNMAITGRPLTAAEEADLKRLNPGSGDCLIVRFPAGSGAVFTLNPIPVQERITLGIPLDIDRMTRSDWESLPGVGPALAARIVDFRQKNGGMMRVDQLNQVEGVGDARARTLARYFK